MALKTRKITSKNHKPLNDRVLFRLKPVKCETLVSLGGKKTTWWMNSNKQKRTKRIFKTDSSLISFLSADGFIIVQNKQSAVFFPEDWEPSLCPVTLVISLRIKSSFLLMVMNPTRQNNPRRRLHTFIYSAGIDWTNIFMPEMIHNSELLCFNSAVVVHHPLRASLVCMCAQIWAFFFSPPRLLSLGTSGAHILCRVCVQPLAAAALGVNFPSYWSQMDKEPRGRLMCISKPSAASEGSCYLTADTQLWMSLCTN